MVERDKRIGKENWLSELWMKVFRNEYFIFQSIFINLNFLSKTLVLKLNHYKSIIKKNLIISFGGFSLTGFSEQNIFSKTNKKF